MTRPMFTRNNKIRDAEGSVDLGDNVTMPERFTAIITWRDDAGEVPFDLLVTVETFDKLPRITSANFRAPDGLPLRMLAAEWDWGWLLEHVMARAVDHDQEAVEVAGQKVTTMVRRANTAMERNERLALVAKTYLAFPGKGVVQHVADELRTSYGTARRLVEDCRKTTDPATGEPYLPAATNGRRTPPAVQS